MKSAVVTGASRGVGRATALALAARGFRLCLLGRESPAQLETLSLLAAAGAEARHIECELSSGVSIAAAAAQLLDQLGAPDVIVHNAGLVERAPIALMSDDVWLRQLDVNLTAPFRLTRALLPSMLERRSGRVLFVSSISAQLGSARQAAYNASKAGLVALMRCLAEELTDSGLMTAAVLPGAIDTEMLEGSGYAPRMTAEQVAATLCFLAVDASVAHNGGITEMFGV